MGLVLKNIMRSIKGYKRIYITLIISQIISVMMLFFSYGVFGSFNLSQYEYEIEQKSMIVTFNEYLCADDIEPVLMKVLAQTEARLDYFFVFGVRDEASGVRMSIYNEYKDGTFADSETMADNTPLLKGRYPTEYELNNGIHVVTATPQYPVGSTIEVLGEQYEVIGNVQDNGADVVHITLASAPKTYQFQLVALSFDKLPTQEDYEVFKSEFEAAFGDNARVYEFEVMDVEQVIAMKSIVTISVVIGIVAAFDTALLYGYLMGKRKRQMAILGITGAKRLHRILINESEIMLITIITSGIGLLLFKYIFERLIQIIYENTIEIYHPKIYLIMLGIYIGGMMLITLILTISTSGNKFLQIKKGSK